MDIAQIMDNRMKNQMEKLSLHCTVGTAVIMQECLQVQSLGL